MGTFPKNWEDVCNLGFFISELDAESPYLLRKLVFNSSVYVPALHDLEISALRC
jgi:hypothetical protein